MMEKLIARTSEEGARQVVWAAIGGKDDEDSLRGAYVSQMGVQEPSDFVLSTEGMTFQEKMWASVSHIMFFTLRSLIYDRLRLRCWTNFAQ